MSDIAQDLGGVVRLLEKLDDGLWREHPAMDYSICLPDETYIDIARTHGKSEAAERDAIAACVNFLRTHSAEIAGALRDAERWRVWRELGEHEAADIAWLNAGEERDAALDAMQQGGGGGE